jgi:hypothetical protein
MPLWFDDVTMQRSERRRRRRGVNVDEATKETMLRRAAHLAVADETLVRLAVEGKHSFRDMARMYRATPGATYRRVKSLLKRLGEPVAAALVDWPGDLPAQYREIGIRHFLRRQPVREMAAELGVTALDVYRANAYVRGWVRAMQRKRDSSISGF